MSLNITKTTFEKAVDYSWFTIILSLPPTFYWISYPYKKAMIHCKEMFDPPNATFPKGNKASLGNSWGTMMGFITRYLEDHPTFINGWLKGVTTSHLLTMVIHHLLYKWDDPPSRFPYEPNTSIPSIPSIPCVPSTSRASCVRATLRSEGSKLFKADLLSL